MAAIRVIGDGWDNPAKNRWESEIRNLQDPLLLGQDVITSAYLRIARVKVAFL